MNHGVFKVPENCHCEAFYAEAIPFMSTRLLWPNAGNDI